jgi:spore maturation protein CgeB
MKNLLNYIEQENAWRKALSVSVKNITSNPNYLRLDTHEERQKIANAGKARALKEHTYIHRLDLLIKTIEGTKHGFAIPNYRDSILLNA